MWKGSKELRSWVIDFAIFLHFGSVSSALNIANSGRAGVGCGSKLVGFFFLDV